MKNKEKYMVVAGLAVTALGLLNASSFDTVFAQTITSASDSAVTQMSERPLLKNIQRQVKNIDNGVVVTMTSTDADTVKKLQSKDRPKFPQDKLADKNITVTQSNITNGVQLTITSTDATMVKTIQEREAQGGFMGKGHGMFGQKGMLKNLDRSVTNVANGVEITMTSTDADTVTKLQAMERPKFPEKVLADKNITVTQTNITNGVRVTITSTDADTVKTIQEREQQHSFQEAKGLGMMGRGHRHGMFNHKNTVTTSSAINS